MSLPTKMFTATTSKQAPKRKQSEPRHKFTPEEDQLLKEVVSKIEGKISWPQVAKQLPNLNAKQCRDRYTSYLSPGLTNDAWTEEEDQLLIKKVAELGTRWKEIASFFNGRGSNNVKNRWYKKLSKTDMISQKMSLNLPELTCSSPEENIPAPIVVKDYQDDQQFMIFNDFDNSALAFDYEGYYF